MPDGTTCNDPINHNRYIEEFICQNSDTTAFQLLDMRQSFPSGHASLAASAMVFCAIYLQARMTWRGSYLGRHFCQFMLVALAIFTGLSRISDYMHHWSDVLTGLILGTVVAVIVVSTKNRD
jgi:phosphatidate phosphatase